MTDIKAVVRVEHPDIVLTETVTHAPDSNVRSVSEAGTDPTSGRFFYHIESPDFQQFRPGSADSTIVDSSASSDPASGSVVLSTLTSRRSLSRSHREWVI